MDGAVGEEEMGAADVQAPEMEGVALILWAARTERVRTKRAISAVLPRVVLAHAQDHIAGTGFVLPLAGIPPAEDAVGAGRSFADAERIAGSVGDVRETDVGIDEQDAIAAK